MVSSRVGGVIVDLKKFLALRTDALQDAQYFISRMPDIFHHEHLGDFLLWGASVFIKDNGQIRVRWRYENENAEGSIALEFTGNKSYTLESYYRDVTGLHEASPTKCNITVPIPDEIVERIKLDERQ